MGVLIEAKSEHIDNIARDLREQGASNLTYQRLSTFSAYFALNADIDDAQLLSKCKNVTNVIGAQPNVKLEPRTRPNDPRLSGLYHLDIIKAYDAWSITTGGKTHSQEDIVIGVIDEGFDLTHEDLVDNIYINKGEIPNDGIDNDNNGFIDDYNGWNTKNNSGKVELKSHGTYVLGAAGAKGNNLKGIVGINWDVKLYPISSGLGANEVIAAYEYLLNQKLLYINTKGLKGANIMVTNFSAGIRDRICTEFPIWNSVYDKLGKAGVLSVTATSNDDINVDVIGDVPSTCESKYLIVVNSSDRKDIKSKETGYGAISVDLAAPGDAIITTEVQNRGAYKEESGTSLSTPIVAGSIALLYSLDCEALWNNYVLDPEGIALDIKAALLKSVDQLPSLQGKTTSGGRLNILKAIKSVEELFLDCKFVTAPKLSFDTLLQVNNQLQLNFTTGVDENVIVRLYDISGKLIYQNEAVYPKRQKSFYNLDVNDLMPGTYFITLFSGQEKVSKTVAIKP